MRAILGTIVCKFGCYPAISHGCWDIKLQRYLGHDLTFWGDVMSSVTWPLGSKYWVSYRWSIRTYRLSRTIFEILSFKSIGVTTLAFRVTWRHVTTRLSRCGFLLVFNMNRPCISHRCWDIKLQRYLGHDPDFFWVTRRHLSRDRSQYGVPIGDQLEPTVYLARLLRYQGSNVLGHDLDLSGHVTSSVTWPQDSQVMVSYW